MFLSNFQYSLAFLYLRSSRRWVFLFLCSYLNFQTEVLKAERAVTISFRLKLFDSFLNLLRFRKNISFLHSHSSRNNIPFSISLFILLLTGFSNKGVHTESKIPTNEFIQFSTSSSELPESTLENMLSNYSFTLIEEILLS